jgi:hypothetical protein
VLGGFGERPSAEQPGGQTGDEREQDRPTFVDELLDHKAHQTGDAGYKARRLITKRP